MKKILGLMLMLAAGWHSHAQAPCSSLSGSLSSGVMAFYPFGNGTLMDLSGSGNNLSNTSSAYPTADRFGTPQCAYHFDKVNGDFLFIPAASSTFLNGMTTAPFSISLWYQPMASRPAGDYELLIGRGNPGIHCPDTWGEWSVGLYDCRKAVVGFDQYSHWETPAAGCASFMASVAYNWHHLAFVFDGTNYFLYIDGTLYSNSSGPCGPMSGNVGPMMLGDDYTGDLDDIVMYNRALTASEVMSLYTLSGSCCNGTTTSTTLPCSTLSGSLGSGVLAFYPFGYGSLSDLGGGAHDLFNFTTAYPTVDRSGNPTCAYHFDKINGDQLILPASGTSFLNGLTTSPFSISLWYQPIGTRPAGDYELLMGRGNTGLHCPDTWGEWSVGLYDCRKAVVGFDQYSHWQTSSLSCSGVMAAFSNSWHHLAFVYDGINYNLFIDGVLYSNSSGPCGPMSANIGPLLLGTDYTGDLDDIVIYNRALSVAEVVALYSLPGSCCDGISSSSKMTNPLQDAPDQLKVYPNPSDGKVFITAGSGTIRAVQVYTNTGSLAASYRFDGSKASIDISQLAAGMYFIKVATDQGTSVAKITKN
jgi:hypothetical protein